MKYSYLALLLSLLISACQTVKIKKETYKVSTTALELGSLGEEKSFIGLQNNFITKTFPKLENKIRVSVQMVPYNKKLQKIYKAQSKFNQNLSTLIYNDSLLVKPEIVVVQIIDISGFINELNAPYNKEILRTISDLQNLEVVSNVAINLTATEITKIKLADTYYLTNTLDAKYTLALFNKNKQFESIDLTLGTILGYQTSKFCWAEATNGKWYIADMYINNSSCKGTTSTKVKNKKKEENLFKM